MRRADPLPSVVVLLIALAALDVPAALPWPVAPPTHLVEVTSALSVGGGVRFDEGHDVLGRFTLALRADVLFARSGPRAFGIGPFVSVRSDHFADVTPALGASWLVPVTEALPLVISAGGALRLDASGVAPGALERVWFGARSYNRQLAYTLAVGVFVEAREFADPTHTVDLVAGLDIDLEVFALPFIGLYTWVARRDPGR